MFTGISSNEFLSSTCTGSILNQQTIDVGKLVYLLALFLSLNTVLGIHGVETVSC